MTRKPCCPTLWLAQLTLVNRRMIAEFMLAILIIVAAIFLIYESVTFINSKGAVHNRWELEDGRQFACVIDAGSSGSRLYIYTWTSFVGESKDLLQITPFLDSTNQPVVKKIEPGLSSMSVNPSLSTDYIKPLLDFAATQIPKHKHRETVLYILATAGMRVLTEKEQNSILDNLRQNIPKMYQFLFTDTSVEIISGKQEGIYQWTSINYILGRFSHSSGDGRLVVVDMPSQTGNPTSTETLFRKQTTGILDMGGVSLQIALEITSMIELERLKENAKQYLAEFNLGCKSHDTDHLYRLYVTTFLGLGANRARNQYETMIVQQALGSKQAYRNIGTAQMPIKDPCLPSDRIEMVNLTLQVANNDSVRLNSSVPTTFYLKGTGNFDACESQLTPVLNNLTNCSTDNCDAQKLFPPSLLDSEFYGVSEFWYSMEDTLQSGGAYNYQTFKQKANDYCQTRWNTLEKRFKEGLYPLSDWHRLRMQCFKSAWVTTVLHNWFGFAKNFSSLTSIANTVNKKVVHWTLGALVFRTKYIPLRSVSETSKPSLFFSTPSFLYLNNYTFLLCFCIVGTAILLYLHRLRCLPRFLVNGRSYSPVPLLADDDELPRVRIHVPDTRQNSLLAAASSRNTRNGDSYPFSRLDDCPKVYYDR